MWRVHAMCPQAANTSQAAAEKLAMDLIQQLAESQADLEAVRAEGLQAKEVGARHPPVDASHPLMGAPLEQSPAMLSHSAEAVMRLFLQPCS